MDSRCRSTSTTRKHESPASALISSKDWKALVEMIFELRTRKKQWLYFCNVCLHRYWRKPCAKYDRSLEEYVKKCIELLVAEAINCQAYATEVKESPKKNPSAFPTPNLRAKGADSKDGKRTPRTRELPLCPWGPHKTKESAISWKIVRTVPIRKRQTFRRSSQGKGRAWEN